MTKRAVGSWRRSALVDVPAELDNVHRTGYLELDAVLSEEGGIVPSQVILATGNPGRGKTTIWAAALAALKQRYPQEECCMLSLEMSDYQLKRQVRRTPGFGEVLVKGDFSTLQELEDEIREMKPILLVVDSLQKMASTMLANRENYPDGNPEKVGSFNAAQKLIAARMTALAKELFITIVLIGHNSKSGVYLGPPMLAHEVDTHFMVDYDKEMESRTFGVEKNRFGGVIDPQYFGITSNGIWIGSPFGNNGFGEEKPTDLKEEVLNMLSELRKESGETMPRSKVVEATKAIVEVLRREKGNELRKRPKGVSDPNKVQVLFQGSGVAHCIAAKGELRFKDVFFSPRFQIGKIGYGREQKFIQKWCKDRVDLMVWTIMHEWCHLYAGHSKHTVDFFREVERLAGDVRWMFGGK